MREEDELVALKTSALPNVMGCRPIRPTDQVEDGAGQTHALPRCGLQFRNFPTTERQQTSRCIRTFVVDRIVCQPLVRGAWRAPVDRQKIDVDVPTPAKKFHITTAGPHPIPASVLPFSITR